MTDDNARSPTRIHETIEYLTKRTDIDELRSLVELEHIFLPDLLNCQTQDDVESVRKEWLNSRTKEQLCVHLLEEIKVRCGEYEPTEHHFENM